MPETEPMSPYKLDISFFSNIVLKYQAKRRETKTDRKKEKVKRKTDRIKEKEERDRKRETV